MPSMKTNLLENIEIILPSMDEQRNIASVLNSLNDKIDLNRQMNSTLEQIAKPFSNTGSSISSSRMKMEILTNQAEAG